jgi:hypothetical protein
LLDLRADVLAKDSGASLFSFMHGISVGLINSFYHVITGGNTILRMAAAHGDVQVRHALFLFLEQIVLAGCVFRILSIA